jgi:hypothetical protein
MVLQHGLLLHLQQAFGVKMNYTEIKDMALGYSDRQDTEITGKMDLFLKMVESKINRALETQPMIATVQTVLVDNVFEYTLPTDFLSIKDIKIVNTDNENYSYPMEMASPERVTTFRLDGSDQRIYAIIGNTVQICSNPYDATLNLVLEISYYQKLPALTSGATTNWVSNSHPDAYIFGLMVEINAYVKDAEATMLWENRFNSVLSEITAQDIRYIWGGPTLKIKVE